MTIAGFDTSCGAGVVADCLTFQNLGVLPLSVVTSLVVETPLHVESVTPVASETLAEQIELLLQTYKISAIKIGLLANPEQVQVVTTQLAQSQIPVVLDPVGIASTGHSLQEPGTLESILASLIPLTSLVTPNIPEARQILGSDSELCSPENLSRELHQKLQTPVLLKGGHDDSPMATDWLISETQAHSFESPRLELQNSLHGTGCVLSSAIAAGLAKGLPLSEAVSQGRDYLREAMNSPLILQQPESLWCLNHNAAQATTRD